MAWSERVLSGRPSRHAGEPWIAGSTRAPGAPQHAEPALPADPLLDEATLARIAAAIQAAETQGYAAGHRQGEQELAGAVAAAQALAQKLETAVPKDVDMLARTVAELSVLIARRILSAELRHDPSVLIAAIEAGLRQAAGASVITVELHPFVVDTVERVWVARHGTRHRGFAWSFTGDPTLSPDGCRLRTEHGIMEAGFEDQLSQVAAALDASIPGYLGAVLGTSPSRFEATAADDPSPGTAPATPIVTTRDDAGPDPEGPGPSPHGFAARVLDDVDLAALAAIGLDGLEDLEALEGLDPGPSGPAEGPA